MPAAVFAQNSNIGINNLIIGTYTEPGKSEGIYVYEFNSATGDLTFKAKATGVTNPSYVAVSPDKKFVYAVNETGGENPGGVSAFSFDEQSGALTFLNKVSAMGDAPCYIDVDEAGKHVVVGNYTGGNLAAFSRQEDGSLSEALQVIAHEGESVDKSRQEKPHVHSTVISPDSKFVMVADLGTDKLYAYHLNDGKKKDALIVHGKPLMVKPGSGPRHITFHPNGNFAYVVHELTAEVSAYKYSNGKLEAIQYISMNEPDFKGNNGAADIHLSADGQFLYASNRGDANEIVIYAVGRDGKLTLAGRQSTLGKTPRSFAIDPSGNFLLAANQGSDNIVVFKRDPQTGLLSDTGKQITVGKPVCLKFSALR